MCELHKTAGIFCLLVLISVIVLIMWDPMSASLLDADKELEDECTTTEPAVNYQPTISNPSDTPSDLGAVPPYLIYSATASYLDMQQLLNFSRCQFKNCVGRFGSPFKDMSNAAIILFQFNYVKDFPEFASDIRGQQYWIVYGYESPGFTGNHWRSTLDGRFNGTVTYRSSSTVFSPYGWTVRRNTSTGLHVKPPTANKTKGAFAYVSNCKSIGYNRLEIMKALKRYVDVDIFGSCTHHKSPCSRMDFECEAKLHSQYRFYLSFENSMCSEYITEKFWSRLASPSMFVPVALGGLSVEEYSRVAPPRSFIHAYNFTSIEELGKYLKHLTEDDTAYNRYHEWRSEYRVDDDSFNMCDLCKLANEKPRLSAIQDVSSWWNSNCNKRIEFKAKGS